MAKIDEKFLEGLTMSGAEEKKIKVEGADKVKMIPFTRPAKADDVLDWKDAGASVIIVMKDGRKYEVAKKKGS